MEPSKPTVKLYITSWCPTVRLARNYLQRRGIEYVEIDIDDTPGAAQQLEEWTGGYRTVPTFDIDGTIVVDFDRMALDELLSPKE